MIQSFELMYLAKSHVELPILKYVFLRKWDSLSPTHTSELVPLSPNFPIRHSYIYADGGLTVTLFRNQNTIAAACTSHWRRCHSITTWILPTMLHECIERIERKLTFAKASFRDIDAPCQAAWDVVNDISAYPSTFKAVTGVEILGSSTWTAACSSLHVGFKYRSHRQTPTGKVLVITWVVTSIDKGRSFPKSVRFLSTMFPGGLMSTFTWTVEPLECEIKKRCRITLTVAISPQKKWWISWLALGDIVFHRKVKKKLQSILEENLRDVLVVIYERCDATDRRDEVDASVLLSNNDNISKDTRKK